MSAKSLLAKILPDSGYRTPLLSYPVLLLAMAAELLALGSLNEHEGWDTFTYVDAMNNFSRGVVDFYRPPVYPYFMIAVRALFGAGHLYAGINFFQALLMIVSAWYFRGAFMRLTGLGPRAAFWTTAVYCLLPQLQWHTMVVMTEAPAVAGMVIMVYWLVRDWPGQMSVRAAVMASLWLCFLIFLRPILMCLIPVVGLWLVIVGRVHKSERRRRKGLAAAWSCLAACVVAVAAYSAVIYRNWGIFTFSGISMVNNFLTASDAGAVFPELTDNAELRTKISRIVGEATVINRDPVMLDTHDVPDLSDSVRPADIIEVTNRAVMHDPGRMAMHLVRRISWCARPSPMLTYTNLRGITSLEVLTPTFGVYMIFLMLFPIWLLKRGKRRRRLAMWLPWCICAVISATSIVGAMSQWARLTLPALPMTIMLVACLLGHLTYKPGKIL